MQIISVIHNCLYFRHNHLKYLFGLTLTLQLDIPALRKIKVDHILLPSYPYLIPLSLFLWQLQALRALKCRSILVADQTIRKRLQQLMIEEELNPQEFKWDVFKQLDINEDNLIKILSEQPVPKPIRCEPYGVGFNAAINSLNLVVAEKGHSIFMINGCDVMLLDPGQKIEQLFQYYGLPFSSLKAIILTNSDNLNIFECLMKQPKVRIVTERSIYEQIKRKLNSYFFWDREMVKNKIEGKIVCDEEVKHKFKNIQFSFKINKKGNIQYWEYYFGLKKIILYPTTINSLSNQIITAPDLDYCIIYDFEEQIKKQLEHCPQVYRKKIIFNRVDRKYNNKYFVTLNTGSQIITIIAHPHSNKFLSATQNNQSFQFQHKDINASLQSKELRHSQQFNSTERVIYVRSGYIKDSQGHTYGVGSCIKGQKYIICEQRATLMYQPESNIYYYTHWKEVKINNYANSQNILNKIKENSFISALKKSFDRDFDSKIATEDPLDLVFQPNSQWAIVNKIAHLKTLQAGSTQISKASALYIVIKGAIKYKNNQAVATKNMMVGNLKSYYNAIFDEGDELEIVKDTWAIEINIAQLHTNLFIMYPQKMYELFSKPMIFI